MADYDSATRELLMLKSAADAVRRPSAAGVMSVDACLQPGLPW